MKFSLSLLLLIVITFLSSAQDLKDVQLPSGTLVRNTKVIDGVTTHTYSSGSSIPINGTPFLDQSFTPGIIELKNGDISDELLLRYNIVLDQFQIKNNNDTLTINKPYQVKLIQLQDKQFIYDPRFSTTEESIRRNGYLQLILDGELSLFLKRNKKMVYDSFVSNYGGGGGTKEYYYVERNSFFCRIEGGAPFIVKNKKSFIKNIPRNQEDVKAFIKSNKINVKEKSDLIKLVNYYNSI